MKSSRRNDRSKSDVPSPSTGPAATPVMDKLRRDMPSEFIDLSTESFQNEFPNLANRRPGTGQPSRPRRAEPPKPGSGGKNDDT